MDYAAIFVGGLLGSAHCVGMCGGLAALCVGSGSRVEAGVSHESGSLWRSALFSAGRVFTYMFLGAVAGRAGGAIAALPAGMVTAQQLLAVAAGLALVAMGLAGLGIVRLPWAWASVSPLAGALGAGALTAREHGAARWGALSAQAASFLGGVATGLLPCGLVYAFLALAAARASALEAALVMVTFGLGTTPLMILSAWGIRRLAPSVRSGLHRLAAGVVALLGLLTIARALLAG